MKPILTLLFGLCIFTVSAQIDTDRPTQSFSPHVMPKGSAQAELGFLSERPLNGVDQYNVTYLNALVRYGLIDWLELRVVQNYQGIRINKASLDGLSPTTIGTKIHLMDADEGFAQVGLLTSLTLTNGEDAFAGDKATKDVRLLASHVLSDKLSLAYNIGGFWTNDQDMTGVYTVMLGISINDELSFFLEPYGFFAKNTPGDQRFNTGLVYKTSDNFQVDASVGNGLTKNAPDYFLSFGMSVLF